MYCLTLVLVHQLCLLFDHPGLIQPTLSNSAVTHSNTLHHPTLPDLPSSPSDLHQSVCLIIALKHMFRMCVCVCHEQLGSWLDPVRQLQRLFFLAPSPGPSQQAPRCDWLRAGWRLCNVCPAEKVDIPRQMLLYNTHYNGKCSLVLQSVKWSERQAVRSLNANARILFKFSLQPWGVDVLFLGKKKRCICCNFGHRIFQRNKLTVGAAGTFGLVSWFSLTVNLCAINPKKNPLFNIFLLFCMHSLCIVNFIVYAT